MANSSRGSLQVSWRRIGPRPQRPSPLLEVAAWFAGLQVEVALGSCPIMPRTADDIERYLDQQGRTYDRQGNTFLVSTGLDGPPIAVHVAELVVVARVTIGPVPEASDRQLALFRQLLEYNATDLIHAAYGLSEGQIVLTAGQELENMDENELSASLGDIEIALSRHVPKLRELARG